MSTDLEIVMFPCLADNYGFLLHDPVSGDTATIDTPDAEEILRQCAARNWTLTYIWNTHHHFDHTGGNLTLKEKLGVEIIGPAGDAARIPGLKRGISGGESFEFGTHRIDVLDTPGHTTHHNVYYVPSARSAFVGDTIFVLGCGRLFEGTAQQMYDSLVSICALPQDTRLYCAHEYTLSNARFAVTIDPDNADLLAYIETAKALREQGLPTVPTTIKAEMATNPFVRAKSATDLANIRAAKDNF